MSTSFSQRVSLICEKNEGGSTTHSDVSTGTEYRIPRPSRDTLYDIYGDCVAAGAEIHLTEIEGDSSPLRLCFSAEECEKECEARVVDIIAISVRNLCSGCREGTVSCCVFLMDDELVIHYPFDFASPFTFTVIESQVYEALLGDAQTVSWAKALVRGRKSPSKMINHTLQKILCCYESSPDLVKSKKTDVDSLLLNVRTSSRYPVYSLLSMHGAVLAGCGGALPKVEDYVLPETETFSKSEMNKRSDEFMGHEAERDVDPRKMVAMIDYKRVVQKSEWLRIGESIYNYTRGCEEGINHWVDCTKSLISRFVAAGDEIPEYLRCDVRELALLKYYNFPFGRVTVLDIAWMAHMDNPKEYMKWHADWCKVAMMDAVSCIEEDVAEAFFRINYLNIITESVGMCSFDWYYFDKHRHMLVPDKNATYITNFIMFKFRMRVRQLRLSIGRVGGEEINCSDEDLAEMRDNIDEMAARLQTLENKLGGSFGDRIVRRAGRKFCNNNLQSLLDADPELTCVKTGVLVATRETIYLRHGRPQDYLTKCTESCIREMTWGNPAVIALVYWSTQTFRDAHTVRFWWKFLGSLLRGGNPDKIFPAIWGSHGNNAKTAWVRIIQKAIGQFCIKGTTSILTKEETNPHAPSSMLVDFSSARLVLCEETDAGGRPIRSSFAKKSTGSDTYYACRKFKEGVQLTPHYVLGIVGNSMPEFTDNDQATRQRFLVFVFDSVWAEESKCADTEPERLKRGVFVIDKNFVEKSHAFGCAALWIMQQYYHDYVKEGLEDVPDKMRKAIDKYWNEKDKYYQFTLEKIEVTENEKDEMSVADVQDVFNAWHEIAYPGTRPPIRSKLVEELARRWGDPSDGTWICIKEKIIETKERERVPIVFSNDNPYSPPPVPITF